MRDDRGRERVGVIVVNWNAGKLLARCIDSLLKQRRRPDRIIVVDNGSQDGSLSAIGERGWECLEVLELGTNTGFAEANNVAVQTLEDCAWIALLNPDAIADADWLAQLMRATEEYPQYAFFGSLLLDGSDANRLDGTGDAYHVSGAHWRRGHGQKASHRDRGPEEIFSPCAAAALYRTAAVREVGGFDPAYFCYSEDVDLGFRLRLAGYKCLYVPNAVVHHVGSATTGGKNSNFAVYYGHRNLVWTYFKDMPGALFWLYLPLHLVMNLVSIIWFASRGQGRVILRAKRDALKRLPAVWQQRRKIQASRRVSAWAVRRSLTRGLLAVMNRRHC